MRVDPPSFHLHTRSHQSVSNWVQEGAGAWGPLDLSTVGLPPTPPTPQTKAVKFHSTERQFGTFYEVGATTTGRRWWWNPPIHVLSNAIPNAGGVQHQFREFALKNPCHNVSSRIPSLFSISCV